MSIGTIAGPVASLIGLAIFIQAWRSIRTAKRAKREWVVTRGDVVSAYAEELMRHGTGNHVVGTGKYRVRARYNYVAGGVEHEGTRWSFDFRQTRNKEDAQKIAGTLLGRKGIDVYYDPHDPGESVLFPDAYRKSYQGIFAGAGFVAIGVALFMFF